VVKKWKSGTIMVENKKNVKIYDILDGKVVFNGKYKERWLEGRTNWWEKGQKVAGNKNKWAK
jgi:hypothetical protein